MQAGRSGYLSRRRSARRTRGSSMPKWCAISCHSVSATICSSCARVRDRRSWGPWKIVILSGIAKPSKTERLASGLPWYRPSRSGRGASCSTTIATFFIRRRKRQGISRSAFSTKSSNSATGSIHHYRIPEPETRSHGRSDAKELRAGGSQSRWGLTRTSVVRTPDQRPRAPKQ
jgi:hypothetical protein